jgi:hypothetical protein
MRNIGNCSFGACFNQLKKIPTRLTNEGWSQTPRSQHQPKQCHPWTKTSTKTAILTVNTTKPDIPVQFNPTITTKIATSTLATRTSTSTTSYMKCIIWTMRTAIYKRYRLFWWRQRWDGDPGGDGGFELDNWHCRQVAGWDWGLRVCFHPLSVCLVGIYSVDLKQALNDFIYPVYHGSLTLINSYSGTRSNNNTS